MLQELCHLAEREQLVGDTAFEVRPVAWIIQLKANGDFIGFTGTHQPEALPEPKKGAKPKKPKEVAKKFVIPRQFNPVTGGARAAGDFAFFLVDKSDYVLGCAGEAKANVPPTDKKLLNRLRLFTEKVRQCFEATKEGRLQAVLAFLERVRSQGLPVDLPEKTAPGDLYAFVVRPDIDEFVHDHPLVQNCWRRVCAGEGQAGESDWQCLITGEPIGEPKLFPLIKKLPGGQAQTGMVSYNANAFESYGWERNSNAPVSADAAQAAAVAMNRLLDPAFQRQDGKVLLRRNIRISEDTVACYWAKEASGDELADGLPNLLQGDDGGKPRELWKAVWKGKPPAKLDDTKFYAVTLTGAQGRAIVRDWYETTVGEVQASVAKYFEQLAIEPNTYPAKGKELPPVFALRTLQECLVASRKADDLPSKYAAELFAACINQRLRFPSSLLGMALERMRAEAGRDEWLDSYRRDARTGLIKAILLRNYPELQLKPTMETNNQPGYLLGQLFACIERMQYLALGDVNAGVAARYFAAASTTPRLVLTNLVRDFEGHYFKKAQRKKEGAAWKTYRDACEIQTRFGKVMKEAEGYPARLSPAEQGLFMVGYHTQRGAYLPRKEKAAAADTPQEPDAAEGAEE
jgi:CRISPR-associated protein Csd1